MVRRKKFMKTDGTELPAQEDEILKLQTEVEDLVWKHDISYLDALQLYCEKESLDIESIQCLISPSLKSLLLVDAQNKNLIKNEFVSQNPLEF